MKTTVIWIIALIVGAILGLLGFGCLDEVMNFVATVYTRLFQLLAVPTIVLAVMTTFATFGSKGSGKIFGRTLISKSALDYDLKPFCQITLTPSQTS